MRGQKVTRAVKATRITYKYFDKSDSAVKEGEKRILTGNPEIALSELKKEIPTEWVFLEEVKVETTTTVYSMSLSAFIASATLDEVTTEKQRNLTSIEVTE